EGWWFVYEKSLPVFHKNRGTKEKKLNCMRSRGYHDPGKILSVRDIKLWKSLIKVIRITEMQGTRIGLSSNVQAQLKNDFVFLEWLNRLSNQRQSLSYKRIYTMATPLLSNLKNYHRFATHSWIGSNTSRLLTYKPSHLIPTSPYKPIIPSSQIPSLKQIIKSPCNISVTEGSIDRLANLNGVVNRKVSTSTTRSPDVKLPNMSPYASAIRFFPSPTKKLYEENVGEEGLQ
ncbi:5908_t:CDS:2, partial [Acaulospora morrowiae]